MDGEKAVTVRLEDLLQDRRLGGRDHARRGQPGGQARAHRHGQHPRGGHTTPRRWRWLPRTPLPSMPGLQRLPAGMTLGPRDNRTDERIPRGMVMDVMGEGSPRLIRLSVVAVVGAADPRQPFLPILLKTCPQDRCRAPGFGSTYPQGTRNPWSVRLRWSRGLPRQYLSTVWQKLAHTPCRSGTAWRVWPRRAVTGCSEDRRRRPDRGSHFK